MPKLLSKKNVLSMFRREVLPHIRSQYEQDRRLDRPARREAWNNFTDALRRDRLISAHAYDTWTCPW